MDLYSICIFKKQKNISNLHLHDIHKDTNFYKKLINIKSHVNPFFYKFFFCYFFEFDIYTFFILAKTPNKSFFTTIEEIVQQFTDFEQ